LPSVKYSVGGWSARLQPVLKVDPRDRDTWLYPECDLCGRPVCDKHATPMGGQVVCDRCRRDMQSQCPPGLIDLGLGRLTSPGGP
jgi:hypothetical protein